MLVSASGGTSAALSYDPGLRLYQVSSASGTTRFAYDGLDMVAEYDGGNLLLRRYVHGPDMDQPLVQYEGTGTTDRRFLTADERGSVIATTDGSGALITANSNDEYGIPGSGNIGRFQYTGQAWLPELGMYHYKARMYSPTLGRFLQTDPIGYGDGMNMYGYVGNDPVNFTDPSGLCTGSLIADDDGQCIGGGFIAGSSAGWTTGSWRSDPSRRGEPGGTVRIGEDGSIIITAGGGSGNGGGAYLRRPFQRSFGSPEPLGQLRLCLDRVGDRQPAVHVERTQPADSERHDRPDL